MGERLKAREPIKFKSSDEPAPVLKSKPDPKPIKKRRRKKKLQKTGPKTSATRLFKEIGHTPPKTKAEDLRPKKTDSAPDPIAVELVTEKKDGRGRPFLPKIETRDLPKLATMAGLGLKVVDIAAIFGLSKCTFERQCKENPSIYEALLKGRAEARIGLTKKAYQMAMSGDTATMIFLLKTQCGFTERTEQININIDASEDEDRTLTRDEKVKHLQEKLTYDDILVLIEKERHLNTLKQLPATIVEMD